MPAIGHHRRQVDRAGRRQLGDGREHGRLPRRERLWKHRLRREVGGESLLVLVRGSRVVFIVVVVVVRTEDENGLAERRRSSRGRFLCRPLCGALGARRGLRRRRESSGSSSGGGGSGGSSGSSSVRSSPLSRPTTLLLPSSPAWHPVCATRTSSLVPKLSTAVSPATGRETKPPGRRQCHPPWQAAIFAGPSDWH